MKVQITHISMGGTRLPVDFEVDLDKEEISIQIVNHQEGKELRGERLYFKEAIKRELGLR